jgi:predicted transcriptional regulator
MACGDIVDVELNDNKFIINTKEALLYDILTDKNNIELIKQALKWQGYNVELVINRILKPKELMDQDIKKLKDLGLNIQIKEI